LFDEDKQALLQELETLPRSSLLRKINEFVARVRRVKAHLCLTAHIKSQLPWLKRALSGDASLKRWVDDRLPQLYEDTVRLRGLSPGDLPSIDAFRKNLSNFDHVTRLPDWDCKDGQLLDKVISTDIPKLMAEIGGVSRVEVSCRPAEPQGSRGIFGMFGGGQKRKRDSF